MGVLVHDCPHCGVSHSSFTIRFEFDCVLQRQNAVAVGAACNACGSPITAVLRMMHNIRPSQYSGNILGDGAYFKLLALYPEVLTHESPDSTPPNVAKAFEQAAGSRRVGHYDAACAMYRKSMELSLRAFSPDIEAWKIEKRIDKMAAEHRITPELQAWAHELRLDGNEAVHGEDEATKETADSMHELCKFLLIYLYTLPAQVAAANARRAGS